jgi:hypothetical protein
MLAIWKIAGDRHSGRSRFRTRVVLSLGVCGVVLTACIASSTRAFDEPEAAQVGLRGILPDEVPEDLMADAFEDLGPNWQSWSEATAAEIARLYEAENLSPGEQAAVIDSLDRRVRVMDRAIADPRYGSIRDELIDLRGRLARRVAVAAAVLETLELNPRAARADRLSAASRRVAGAVDDLDAYLNRIPNGTPWLGYVRADNLRESLAARPAAPATVSLANGVREKLRNRNSLSEPAQREFLNRPQFVDLEGSLDAYLVVARADAGNNPQNLRGQLAQLVAALEAYERTQSREAAAAARSAYSTVRRQSPDGGASIAAVLQTQYLNHNLRVFADESIVNRFFSQTRTDTGPVVDFIMGANVSGAQTTVTEVGVNLKPGRNIARFDLTLNGAINSQTTGVTKQAAVYTSGNHFFYATKEIVFDGDQFATLPAAISVNPNNMTVGADTKASGIPLLGGIARKIAVRESERRRPESEAIAAQRVSSRVVPEFDAETDQNFLRTNAEMQQRNARLQELGLFPQARHFSSTHDQLRISSQLMGRGELAGSAPPLALNLPDAVNVHLHQSLMNNGLDRMNLAGRALSDEELIQEFERFFSQVLDREMQFERPEPPPVENDEPETERGPTAMVFSETDPIRIRISDGVLAVTFRAAFRQEDREDIPEQEITIPLGFSLEGDDLVIQRVGTIRISAVERPRSIAEQIAHAGVIRRMIERATPERRVRRFYLLDREDHQPPVQLELTQIKATDGWLTISAQ